MPVRKRIILYKFEELKGKARERALAIGHKMFLEDGDDFREALTEMFQYELNQRGYPSEDIQYSLSNSQGDGMAFYGRFDAVVVAKRLGFELPFIKDGDTRTWELQDRNIHYHHYNSMRLVVIDDFVELSRHKREQLVDTIVADVRNVSRELEAKGYALIESIEKEAPTTIADTFAANGYLFYSNGEVFPSNQ